MPVLRNGFIDAIRTRETLDKEKVAHLLILNYNKINKHLVFLLHSRTADMFKGKEIVTMDTPNFYIEYEKKI